MLNTTQHKLVIKLLGFDFEIAYYPKVENKVTNVLSRKSIQSGELLALSKVQPMAIEIMEKRWQTMTV